MVKGSVQNVNSGYLLGLHSNVPFPCSLHLYEWYTCFTMDMNGLKKLEKKQRYYDCAPIRKRERNIFLATKKCFLCCFYAIPSPQWMDIESFASDAQFLNAILYHHFLSFHGGKEYSLVVEYKLSKWTWILIST